MPHTTPSRSSRAAFTLIELLTVIAIIGILAAIIIPVVGKVRKQARIADTTSNMRQVGQAMAAYLVDNRDWMPYARQGKGLQPSTHEYVRLITPTHNGNGDWSDRGTRLGAHIAPYVGVKGPDNSEVSIPALRDSLWRAATEAQGGAVDGYWCVATFVLNPGLSRTYHPGISAATIYPWGKDSTTPIQVAASAGYGRILSQIGTPSRVWAMIQNDRQLITDSGGAITNGMVGTNAPLTPVNGGTTRLALMFDWSVRTVQTTHDLRKPL